VTEADAAWRSGDAEKAFATYTEALELGRALDTDGAVKAKQDKAKNLVLARRIIGGEPGPEQIGDYAQAVTYASPDSTESAAARKGLAACFEEYSRSMRRDIKTMRARIRADKSVEGSMMASMVESLGSGWLTDIEGMPDPSGKRARSAIEHLQAAATWINKAFDRTYAEDALADLKKADSELDASDAAFKALVAK